MIELFTCNVKDLAEGLASSVKCPLLKLLVFITRYDLVFIYVEYLESERSSGHGT